MEKGELIISGNRKNKQLNQRDVAFIAEKLRKILFKWKSIQKGEKRIKGVQGVGFVRKSQ
jgi:hypothetical protein